MQHGLVYCHSGFNSYCIFKLLELLLSALISFFASLELYHHLSLFTLKMHWKLITLAFILISLIINIFFCLWNSTYQLYSLESYFNSLYFLTIVADVCRLYLRKNNWNSSSHNYIFAGGVLLLALLYTAILIDSLVQEDNTSQDINCQQIWYLCVNVACLLLCFVALIVLLLNHRQEKQKLIQYQFQEGKVNNPLARLWVWIGINTTAQILNLVQSGLLIKATPAQKCMIIGDDENSNNVLMFGFTVVTLYMGYLATLWYIRQLRVKSEQAEAQQSSFSQEYRVNYGLQMLNSFGQ